MRVRRYTYPHYWKKIARALRAIRGMKCEQCGAPNGVYIQRLIADKYVWAVFDGVNEAGCSDKWTDPTFNKVSIHHIGIDKPDGAPGSSLDKGDCRPKNLIALCARCHLIADKEVSGKHARETKYQIKRARIRQLGQIEMFSE